MIRRSLSLISGARVILSSSATWLDRAVHPFALFNALTAILASFGALTALFNSSNSGTYSHHFCTLRNLLTLSLLAPFLLSRRVLPAYAPIARLLHFRRAMRL